MKAYVVMYEVGEYEDRNTDVDKVFLSLNKAEQYAESQHPGFTLWLRSLSESVKRFAELRHQYGDMPHTWPPEAHKLVLRNLPYPHPLQSDSARFWIEEHEVQE